MSYREQEDALRARIATLEAELSAARGKGLKDREENASRFEGKLRRQSWLILIAGGGLTLLGLIAAVDPVVGLLERLAMGRPLRLSHEEDLLAGLFFFAVAAVAWGGLLLQKRVASKVVELPTMADRVTRDPGLMTALGFGTCGLFSLWWAYRTTASLQRITGRPDLSPVLDLVMTLATFGLWRAWADWRNAEALDEALAGRYEATQGQVFLLWAIGLFCFFTPGLVPWVLQRGYNELAELGLDQALKDEQASSSD